jgi:thiol-disulfide isomerase/thioredoxin
MYSFWFVKKKMEFRRELEEFLRPISTANVDFKDIKNQHIVSADELPKRLNGNPAFLLVYRDGCPHCEHFKPNFVKLVQFAKEWNDKQDLLERNVSERKKNQDDTIYKKFLILAMDSRDPRNDNFMSRYNVLGVPTLFFISSNGSINEYTSSRNPEQIWNDLKNLKSIKKMYY